MKKLLPLVLLLTVNSLFAQKNNADDVKSVDAIVAALYDVISGDPGKSRDWDRFKNIFWQESRLIPTRKGDKGETTLKPITPEQYIELFSTRITTGFYERELHRVLESYGTVTHVFSTYETREKKDGPVTNRGINSIQIFNDGQRYYVVNIFWCAESMGFTLPEKYLK